MKNKYPYFCVVLALGSIFFSTHSRAEKNETHIYSGVTLGYMTWDNELEDAVLVGLGSEYRWNKNWAVGIEYNQTLNEADIELTEGSGKYDYFNVGLSGVYRTDTNPYLKAKVGYFHENINLDYGSNTNEVTPNVDAYEGEDLKVGFGFGYEILDSNIEVLFSVR
jgi:Outer membrane protein beta-barrel domain